MIFKPFCAISFELSKETVTFLHFNPVLSAGCLCLAHSRGCAAGGMVTMPLPVALTVSVRRG